MAKSHFQNLRVYKAAEHLADTVWDIVVEWNAFAKETVGRQLVRSADSVGANIAEGTGRGTFKDNRRFVQYARGSLYETKFHLRRAQSRRLLHPEQTEILMLQMEELPPMLNAYLNSIGKKRSRTDESE